MLKYVELILLAGLVLSSCGDSKETSSDEKAVPPAENIGRVNTRAEHEEFQAVFNDNGDGLAMWQVTDIARDYVLYSIYNAKQNQWSEEQVFLKLGVAEYIELEIIAGNPGFLVTWIADTGDLLAKVYDGESWSRNPQTIISAEFDEASRAQITSKIGGEYLIVWIQDRLSSRNTLYSSYYNSNSGWNQSQLNDALSGEYYIKYLQLESNDDTFAVFWTESQLYSSVFDNNSKTWTRQIIPIFDPNNLNTLVTYSLQSVANSIGFAATWKQGIDNYASVYSNGSWSAVNSAINNPSATVTRLPGEIAASGAGFSVAWVETTANGTPDLYNNVLATNYPGAGSEWNSINNPPKILDSSAKAITDSKIKVLGGSTKFMLLWSQQDDQNSFDSIYGAEFDGTSWADSPTIVFDGTAGSVADLDKIYMSATNAGDSFAVVWPGFFNDMRAVFGNTFTGQSWNGAQLLSSPISHTEFQDSQLVSGAQGHVVAWIQTNGSGAQNDVAVVRMLGNYDVLARVFSIAENKWSEKTVLEHGLGTSRHLELYTTNNHYMSVWQQISSEDDTPQASLFDGSWLEPINLVNTPRRWSRGVTPKIAANKDGETLVVWRGPDMFDEDDYVLVARINRGNEWDEPRILDTESSHMGNIQILTNGSGFLISWLADEEIHAIVYDKGQWLSGLKLNTGLIYDYQITTNGIGYAITWQQKNGIYSDVVGLVYDGDRWTGVQLLSDPDLSNFAESPGISSDGKGYAVTWIQDNGGSKKRVYATFYQNGIWNSFSDALDSNLIETHASDPQIVSNGKGYAISWSQVEGAYSNIYARVWDGQGWDASPSLLDSGDLDSDAINKELVAGNNGYAIVWSQKTPVDGFSHIYTRVYADSNWSSSAQSLDDANLNSHAIEPKISSNGSAYAVIWLQGNAATNNDLVANIFDGSWGGAVVIDNVNATHSVKEPWIVSNGEGYGLIWRQRDQSDFDDIHSRIYSSNTWGDIKTLDNQTVLGNAFTPRMISSHLGYEVIWAQNDPGEYPFPSSVWVVKGL